MPVGGRAVPERHLDRLEVVADVEQFLEQESGVVESYGMVGGHLAVAAFVGLCRPYHFVPLLFGQQVL